MIHFFPVCGASSCHLSFSSSRVLQQSMLAGDSLASDAHRRLPEVQSMDSKVSPHTVPVVSVATSLVSPVSLLLHHLTPATIIGPGNLTNDPSLDSCLDGIKLKYETRKKKLAIFQNKGFNKIKSSATLSLGRIEHSNLSAFLVSPILSITLNSIWREGGLT